VPRRYLLLLIVFPLAAIPAFIATFERRDLQRAARTYAQGARGAALVTGKEIHSSWGRKGSSTTHYLVSLDTPDGPFQRRVQAKDWERAQKGESTDWYRDPQGAWGCSEFERAYLNDAASYGVLLFLALAVVWICSLGWWQGLPGGVAAAKVRKGGVACPETRNLRLPEPERSSTPGFDRWLRERYPRSRALLGMTLAAALAIGLPAALAGFFETTALMALQGMIGAGVILLAHLRGTRRDRLLWRRGLERHAAAAVAKRTGNVFTYEVSFDLEGQVYTLQQRLPIETEALRGDQNRVVVLVDPKNPRRATVVPRGV
jgi:hypothetical protein